MFSCRLVPLVKCFINVIRYWGALYACSQVYQTVGDMILEVHYAPSKKSGCTSQRNSTISPAAFACTQPQGDKLQLTSLCACFRPSKSWMLAGVLCPLPSPQPPSSNKRHYCLLWAPLFQDTEFNNFGLSAYSSDGAFLESKEEGTRVMFAFAAKEIELNSTWLVE